MWYTNVWSTVCKVENILGVSEKELGNNKQTETLSQKSKWEKFEAVETEKWVDSVDLK